jgi:hypothetical protein
VIPHDTGESTEFRRGDVAAVEREKEPNDVRSRNQPGKKFFHQGLRFLSRERLEAFGFFDQ